jgi:hypothetical protein
MSPKCYSMFYGVRVPCVSCSFRVSEHVFQKNKSRHSLSQIIQRIKFSYLLYFLSVVVSTTRKLNRVAALNLLHPTTKDIHSLHAFYWGQQAETLSFPAFFPVKVPKCGQ